MKIILNSYTGIGAWFILRLQDEGHSVYYHYTGKPDKGDGCLQGLVPGAILGDVNYGEYDLSIFDLTGKPRLADTSLRSTPTLGDSSLASKLEEDRLFGIEIMEQAGINVPPYEVFDSISVARKFVSKTKKRYVFKPNGGQDQSSMTTYVSNSADDLLEYLDNLEEQTRGVEFILQEFIPNGCELSTEAWFNGENFYLVNGTIEEKKFMNDNLGPATGCAGNLVWVYAAKPKVFTEGLEKLGGFLYETGYRGMCDLNTILTDGKLYGLEWTPRFGYDASPTLFSLLPQGSLGDFLYAVAAGEPVASIQPYTGVYSAAVRVSIPPYPFEELKHGLQQVGVPLGEFREEYRKNFWLWDACYEDGKFCTCGEGYGVIGAPIQTGSTPDEAFNRVYDKLKHFKVPNIQYRTDMCKQAVGRLRRAESMGWLRP